MNNEQAFIAHLKALAGRDDRGALAALRRGLSAPSGWAPEMERIVAPVLPQDRWGWPMECCYMVAALFGSHPESVSEGNLGDTLRQIAAASGGDSIEKRFIALLKCHRDDLFGHLRQAIGLARSKEAPVNWLQLLWDMQQWDHDDARVQRRWARSFWSRSEERKENLLTQDLPEGVTP